MKKYLNRKVISLTATAFLITLAVVGSTLAYYSDTTANITNTFTIGTVETVIEEKFNKTGDKDVTIKNVGESDCYIRARITVSPENALNIVKIEGLPGDNWTKESDGFYYFENAIAPNMSTSSLFKGYQITDMDNFIPFEVTIYQEAVQAAVFNGTDHVYSREAAWETYDNGTSND